MCESIKIIIRSDRNARILVLTPSNAAADHIVDRLSADEQFDRRTLIRVNPNTRDFSRVSPATQEFSKRNADSELCAYPSLQELLGKRVVVTTLLEAAVLYSQGVFDVDPLTGNPPFGRVFVDECGHCTEPEFWAGVSGLANGLFRPPAASESDERRELFKQICGSGSRRASSAVLPQLVISGDPCQLGPTIRFPLV